MNDKILLDKWTTKVNGRPRGIAEVQCPDCGDIREMRHDSYLKAATTCCRSCINLRRPTKPEDEKFQWDRFYRSREGKASCMYSANVQRCQTKGWPLPHYTREELVAWLMTHPTYHQLFDIWEASGYTKALAPSIDRLDDYQTYSFNNIRLVAWKDNNTRGCQDQRKGQNLKQCKAVDQLDLNGSFIRRFHSIIGAARELGIDDSKIGDVCRARPIKKGNRWTTPKTAGGFKWRYSKVPNRPGEVT